MKRFATPLMAVFLFLLNVTLNAPLFMAGELPFRGSVEGGYVSMARFLSQHPNPWGWNPLPYCGLPTQFMYVPNMPYLAALFIHLLPGWSPDQIFRILVSLAACAGPVTLFLFALYFTGSRKWSFAMAVAYSIMSPSYALFPAVEEDKGVAQMAWRIKVLAKYGEGPHNTGLTLLPLALVALWRAATRRGYPVLLGASLLLAVIPLTNWVAAFGLAVSCAVLLLAAWGEKDFSYRRAIAAAGLAYLLACFWLTPSFVETIAFNWPVDSYGYKVHETQAWSLAGMIVFVALARVAFRFLGGSFYFRYVTLATLAFGWIAAVYYILGADTVPESHRYAIEFELFCALALVEALRLTLQLPHPTIRMCAMGTAGVMLLVGAPQVWNYVTQGWDVWEPSPPEKTIEYKLAQWIEQHPPEGRVLASGGMRFRMDSWFDIPQVGGGFETGLQDRMPVDLAYQARMGNSPWKGHDNDAVLLDLKGLGVQYVVVHGQKSREYYRDFAHVERISSSLETAFHVEDDTIYALPAHPLAHLMKSDEVVNSNPAFHPQALMKYVAAIEDGSRPPLSVDWEGPSSLTIAGPVPAGDVVALQVNDDPGWSATQDGRAAAIEEDKLGFMVVHASPSPATKIELHYHGTVEQKTMALVSVLAWIGAVGALFRRRTVQLARAAA